MADNQDVREALNTLEKYMSTRFNTLNLRFDAPRQSPEGTIKRHPIGVKRRLRRPLRSHKMMWLFVVLLGIGCLSFILKVLPQLRSFVQRIHAIWISQG